LHDRASLKEGLLATGNNHYELGETTSSEESYRQGLSLCVEPEDELMKSILQRQFSMTFERKGFFTEAFALLHEALDIQYKYSAKSEIPRTLYRQANLYLIISDWKSSLICLGKILEYLETDPNPELESKVLHIYGYIYYDMDELEKSMEAFTKQLEVSRTIKNEIIEA